MSFRRLASPILRSGWKTMKKTVCLLAVSASLAVLAMALSYNSGVLFFAEGSSISKIDSSLQQAMSCGGEEIPFIVMFKPFQTADEEQLSRAGVTSEHIYHIIEGAAGVGSSRAIRDLADQQWVEAIYLDGTVQAAGPIRADDNFTVTSPARMVNASALWEDGINGSGVVVAVMDSGIDKNHPDLIGKVIGEVNYIKNEETTNDLLGHGTMCAAIIAGSGKASGGKYRGIAPGASLLNVRVIDSDGRGKDSDIISGIEWAMNNGADVISMSLGGMDLGETDLPVTTAADKAMDAGVVVCVASGNSG